MARLGVTVCPQRRTLAIHGDRAVLGVQTLVGSRRAIVLPRDRRLCRDKELINKD